MGIALSLEQYLDGRGVPYEVRTHERTLRSSETAQASVIPENNLAKGVLIKRKDGHLLAIVPASCPCEPQGARCMDKAANRTGDKWPPSSATATMAPSHPSPGPMDYRP